MVNKPAKKQSAKKAKKAGKKAVAKRGATKRIVVPRKRRSPEANRYQLEQDVGYYNEQSPNLLSRRTKGTARHHRGLPIGNLHYDARTNTYRSVDNDIILSEREYKNLSQNPYAVPLYTPIRERKNGKTRVVAFRNTITGKEVSPYYRYQIFGKEFNKTETPEQVERANLYTVGVAQQRRASASRHYDLVRSYRLLHPELTPNEVVSSVDFQDLVIELGSFNYRNYGITLENVEIADTQLGGSFNRDLSEQEVTLLKDELGLDPRYQQVLVLLGRRLPSDTNPVGESDPGHIKFTVAPFYETANSAVEFEEE